MSTVLILGAGAVRAAAATAARGRLPPLDVDFFAIARLRRPRLSEQITNQLRTVVGEYASSVTASLETTTTYLYLKALESARDSFPHRVFIAHLTLLRSVLADTTNSIRVGPRSTLYRLVRRELARLARPEDLSIVTFNWTVPRSRLKVYAATRCGA